MAGDGETFEVMQSPTTRSGAAGMEAALSRFLQDHREVEAVLFDDQHHSISLAVLGQVDSEELERSLMSTLEELGRRHGRLGARAAVLPGAVRVRHLPGQTLLEKPSCPTAPRLWHWRTFKWPEVTPQPASVDQDGEEWRLLAVQAGVCGLALAVAFIGQQLGALPDSVAIGLYAISLVAGGWDAAIDSFAKIRKGVVDIHFLMLTVAVGAVTIGAWAEGALLLFLFSSSGAIEHFALHRTHREIEALTKAAPKFATVRLPDGSTEQVPTELLEPDQVLSVKPDEVFPVDAEILDGETACDESNLTGEATPAPKRKGDPVWSGTLNLWGVVTAKVLRPAEQSALQKIIDLIRNAEQMRAPSQRFTDRFGAHYTYGVLAVVTAMFFVWWLGFGLPAFENTEASTSAFYRAMTLLVVASPCALVLSIPSAILAAIASGARRGILYRGGAAIEKLSEIDTVALDKTGTLTTGELSVNSVESFPPGREAEVLEVAFTLESSSNHPLARAITAHGKRLGLKLRDMHSFESLTGQGLRASVGERATYLGRRELIEVGSLKGLLEKIPEPPLALTEVWIIHEELIGRVLLQDQVRTESKAVLEELDRMGIRTIMLTGDRRGAAERVAEALGVTEVRAGLHPEDKVEIIRDLTEAGHRVAMVGDGVNDTPSLAAAHVSIAMGGRGSDAALEQSDIVLMNDRIERLLTAFRGTTAARAVIRQNLAISLGTVALMVVASLFGIVPLPIGVIAHEGSTLIVCLNSLRLLFRND